MAKQDNNSHSSWFDVGKTIDNDSYVSDVNHPSSIDGPIIDDAEVVYEEDPNQTIIDKIKYFISTINTKVLIVLVAIFLVILIIGLVIFLHITKINNSYTSEIVAPDVIYMGESSKVYVTAKGQKGLSETVTTFESDNNNIAAFYKKKIKGKEVENVLTPVQEGRTIIKIKSNLGSRKLAYRESDLVVCPSFTADLLLSKSISIVEGTTYNLPVDFGEKECSDGITYTSLDTNIMTVNDKGTITGVTSGSTTLVVKRDDRSVSIPVTITKSYIPMNTFKIIPSKVQLVPEQNIRLKVEYAPVDATISTIKFSSSDKSIVNVSPGGLVTAIKPGTAKIYVMTSSIMGIKTVEVVVSEAKDGGESGATEINLNKSDVNLVEGTSEKIIATVVPDDEENKTLKWSSSDENVATVDKNGVISAKGEGSCVITVSTLNDVSRTINVKVIKMKIPVITASDNILSGRWHKASYVLKFSGSEENVVYYYGTSSDKIDQTGSQITISKDESTIYYVQGCKNVCTNKCNDENKTNCTKVCKKGVCSNYATYVSKVDLEKPQVLNAVVTPGNGTATAHITLKDDNSYIQKWCVTIKDEPTDCKWTTLTTPQSNPVVTYTATEPRAYYVFAIDTAGNISDNYRFRADGI